MARSLRLLLLSSMILTFAAALPVASAPAYAVELDKKGKSDAKEAMRFYKEGNYEDAAKLFLRLSMAYPDMLVFVRNLGACYYYMRRYEPALSNLRDYLHRKADIPADDRAEVAGWIGEMERLRDQAVVTPAAPPAAPPSAAPPAAAPPPTDPPAGLPVPVPPVSGPGVAPAPGGGSGSEPSPAPAPTPTPAAPAPPAPDPAGEPVPFPPAAPPSVQEGAASPMAGAEPAFPPQYPAQPGYAQDGQYPAQPGYAPSYGAPPGYAPQGVYEPQPAQPMYGPGVGPAYPPGYGPQPGYAPAASPEVTAPVAPPPESTGSGRKVAAWLLGLAGVGTIGLGGYFTYQASSRARDLEKKYDPSKEDQRKTAVIASGLCYGLGGAAFVGAIVLGATGGSSGQVALTPAVGPEMAGAALGGSF